MTSIRVTQEGAAPVARPARRPSMRQRLLLVSGLLSSLVYVATDVASALRLHGYRYAHQAVSELSAVGAPTAGFWSGGMAAYTVLFIAFAIGVLKMSRGNRPLRVTGVLLLVFIVSGQLWRFFPMHPRGTETNWQDVGHIVLTVWVVLLMLVWTGVGAFALGRRFRAYSFATIAALLAGAAWSFTYASRIAAGAPTPWLGVVERVNIYGYLLWIAVISAALLRRQER